MATLFKKRKDTLPPQEDIDYVIDALVQQGRWNEAIALLPPGETGTPIWEKTPVPSQYEYPPYGKATDFGLSIRVRKPRKSVRKPRKSVRKPRKSVRKPRKSVQKPRKSVRKPKK